MNVLEQFGIIPIDFATLVTIFGDYKSPKDKIANLEKRGELIRLKKGLFVVSPKLSGQLVSKELIANHLYGPSYISLESALAFHKLIPERVHTTRSMTLKRGRKFSTPLGNFEYITTEKEYYSIGLQQKIADEKYAFIIASPEKAICDMLIASPRLRIQSPKAMRSYLEEGLRIDFLSLESFNIDIIRQCIAVRRKKTELHQLYKLLER